jgi:hypothetical protein
VCLPVAAAAAGASAISLAGRIAARRTTSNDTGILGSLSLSLSGGGAAAGQLGRPTGLGLAGKRLQQQQLSIGGGGGAEKGLAAAAAAAGVPAAMKSRFDVLERVRVVDLGPRSISADARF